jgi:hypothetical protein
VSDRASVFWGGGAHVFGGVRCGCTTCTPVGPALQATQPHGTGWGLKWIRRVSGLPLAPTDSKNLSFPRVSYIIFTLLSYNLYSWLSSSFVGTSILLVLTLRSWKGEGWTTTTMVPGKRFTAVAAACNALNLRGKVFFLRYSPNSDATFPFPFPFHYALSLLKF